MSASDSGRDGENGSATESRPRLPPRAGGNEQAAAPSGSLAELLARRRSGWNEHTGRPRLRRALLPAFREACAEDLERGRGLVWGALVFACGIAAYFSLPGEPAPLVLSAIVGTAWLAVALAGRAGRGRGVLTAAAILLTGMLAGAIRTATVSAPVIERARSVTVAGHVEAVEQRETGTRLLLRVRDMERVAPDRMPARVRLSLRGEAARDPPRPGDAVRLRARLMPPAPAVMPGGYDFAFRAYFDGIGATGFVFGKVERIDLGPVPRDLRALAGVAGLRAAIAGRIRQALGETTAAALAVALITGDRSRIPPDVTEALRTAGLAHILAISGLHMALFAGSVFFVLRALLALSPRLTQEWPVDLWAAALALAAAAFYLAISGASIATQRAFVMIALVLGGRLFGRRAITLRNAGIAMLLILAATPESLLDPGFQMSFAAVIALIAAYEEMTRRRNRTGRDESGPKFGPLGRIAGWFGAILLTSLIAGAATGAIGAYHFHRIAPLGPLVNLLAMPLVTVVVMPFAVLALALIPLGLESLPLAAMGHAVDLVVTISRWATDLTPGEGVIGAPSTAATLLMVAAGTVACVGPGGFRRLALLPLCLSLWFYASHRQPDMLVSASGTALALRDADGMLRVTSRPSGFVSEVWLRAEGVASAERARRRLSRDALRCDELACVARAHARAPGNGRDPPASLIVSLVRDPLAFDEDCRRAGIIVSAHDAPAGCAAAHVLDGARLSREGSLALYFEDGLEAEGDAPDGSATKVAAAGNSGADDKVSGYDGAGNNTAGYPEAGDAAPLPAAPGPQAASLMAHARAPATPLAAGRKSLLRIVPSYRYRRPWTPGFIAR